MRTKSRKKSLKSEKILEWVVDGIIWFVAKDVCDILGISNVSQALSQLDEDEKGICKIYTLGGSQEWK